MISPVVPPVNSKLPEIIDPVLEPEKVLVVLEPDTELIDECFKYSVSNNEANSVVVYF